MPETGPRAPARMLVAVRAMVPVTQMPPNIAEPMLADALRDELAIGAVPAPGHAVGDDGRQQRLDSAEQREGEGIRQNGLRFWRARIAGSAGDGSVRGMPPNRDADGRDRRGRSTAQQRRDARRRSACPGQAGRTRAGRR